MGRLLCARHGSPILSVMSPRFDIVSSVLKKFKEQNMIPPIGLGFRQLVEFDFSQTVPEVNQEEQEQEVNHMAMEDSKPLQEQFNDLLSIYWGEVDRIPFRRGFAQICVDGAYRRLENFAKDHPLFSSLLPLKCVVTDRDV